MSDTATKGLWFALGAAITVPVIVAGVVQATTKKTSCPSGDIAANSDGTCKAGYVSDPSYSGCCMPETTGVTCPSGDVAANSDGSCQSGYVADPDNPGCCKPQTTVCPNSCSADSDCSGCGQDFVCESGQCIKQIPATIDAPLSSDCESKAEYTTTCCEYFVYSNCLKCGAAFTPNYTSGVFDVYVRDSSGRGIPGVTLMIQSSVNATGLGFKFLITDGTGQQKSYDSGKTATAITDSDGKINVVVEPTTMPTGWDNIQNTNYPCLACNATPAQSSVETGTFGRFNYTVVGTQITGVTLITDTVTYHGNVVEVGGCSCL